MFNTLKGLLNVGKHILTEETPHIEQHPIDPNIGAELLAHYQQQWSELHTLNEDNAVNASKAADDIEKLHSKISSDQNNLGHIFNFLAENGPLKTHINACLSQLTSIHDDFDRVEKSLLSLEDVIEKVEQEQRKIEHRHQLALYKEKKLVSLESARTLLAAKHSQSVVAHELKQKKVLEERQQVFQDAFKKDLETYKTLGGIPKVELPARQPSALLEDIELEIDKEVLDQFLEES